VQSLNASFTSKGLLNKTQLVTATPTLETDASVFGQVTVRLPSLIKVGADSSPRVNVVWAFPAKRLITSSRDIEALPDACALCFASLLVQGALLA